MAIRVTGASFRFARRPGLGGIGLVLTVVIVVGALAGPFLAPQSPQAFIGAPFDPPSSAALLGMDFMGRDVLSRVLAGGWRILAMSTAATLLGVSTGALFGILSGYRKGLLDELTMRLSDVALSFPQTILALLFLSIIGPSRWVIVLLVAAIHAPQVARVIRSVALKVAEEDYVRYAEAIGFSTGRIVLTEILPNVISTLIVEFGLRLTYSIALIASLGFLGFSEDPAAPDWGIMINENRIGLDSNPWGVAAPVAILALLTIGVNLFFDALALWFFAGGLEAETNAAPDSSTEPLVPRTAVLPGTPA
jgi:peptide/nickel transport system permease protein